MGLHLHLHLDRNGNGNEIVSSHKPLPSSAGAIFPFPLDIPARGRCKPTPLLDSEKRGAMPDSTYSSGRAGGALPLAIFCAKVTFVTKFRHFFNPESSVGYFSTKAQFFGVLITLVDYYGT